MHAAARADRAMLVQAGEGVGAGRCDRPAPAAPSRPVRGGTFNADARDVRSASRSWEPHVMPGPGFRIVWEIAPRDR